MNLHSRCFERHYATVGIQQTYQRTHLTFTAMNDSFFRSSQEVFPRNHLSNLLQLTVVSEVRWNKGPQDVPLRILR